MRLFSNMLTFNRVKDGEDGKEGKPGEPGEPGKDGVSTYVHIMYSVFYNGLNSDGRTQMTSYPTKKTKYIGIANTNDSYPPVKAQSYTWSRYVGEVGPMPANYGPWQKDFEYIKDEFIQPYVWQIKNGKKLYYLLVAERSLGDDPYTNNTQGNGDIWRYREEYDLFLARKIQADEIDTSNLVARHIRTEVQGPRIEASGSEMHIYGQEEHPNIIFGVNSQGYAVLAYYTGGKKLYDLGPSGLKMFDFAPEKWTERKYIKIAGLISGSEVTYRDLRSATDKSKTLDNATTFWHYYAGGSPDITNDKRQLEQYTYKTQSTSLYSLIDDGWYYTPPFMENGFFMIPSHGTGNRIRPTVNLVDAEDIMYPNPLGVIDEHPIHYVHCMLYSLGKVVAEKVLIWNGDKEGGYQPRPDLP